MKCANDSLWKKHGKVKKMSEFITPSMEAFIVVAYFNCYDHTKRTLQNATQESRGDSSDDTTVSSISTVENGRSFLYTGQSRGATRNGGWSPEGVAMYNKLVKIVKAQRTNSKFDTALLRLVMQTEKKRKRRSITEVEDPENDLDQLGAYVSVTGEETAAEAAVEIAAV